MVAEKVHMAHEFGIIPIVCVGEKNKSDDLGILQKQVSIALSKALEKEVVFAYEPVWAIGTGEIPTVKGINSAIKIIKDTAKMSGYNVKVLYGGSMDLSNHEELKRSKADGFFMGGVSLRIDDFVQIVKGE